MTTYIAFPDALITLPDELQAALVRQRRELLEVCGVQLLQFAQLDYRTKARGGTGTDGISWEPILVSTLMARLRRAGQLKVQAVAKGKQPAKLPIGARQKVVIQVAKTVKHNKALFSELEKAGVQFRDKKSGSVLTGDKPRYRAGTYVAANKQALNKRITVAPGSYEIGVDTGLQVNSAQPGYKAPDSKGGNITEYKQHSVTVGFGRSYSEHFDKRRKLFPDTLPPSWVAALEELVADAGGKIIQDAIESKGLA